MYQDLKNYRYDYTWIKSQASGFFNAKKRPLRAHEFVLVFCRHDPIYCAQMLETGVPISSNTKSGVIHTEPVSDENYGSRKRGISRAGKTDRFPTSVLSDKCVGNRSKERVHPQQKPDSLFENLVLTYTEPGALVADPCSGSGVTARACQTTARSFRCWDLSERFAGARL
jgi:site-specific DNA-methyltransferase (adenine-specific)